jgi:hypothetical protein
MIYAYVAIWLVIVGFNWVLAMKDVPKLFSKEYKICKGEIDKLTEENKDLSWKVTELDNFYKELKK